MGRNGPPTRPRGAKERWTRVGKNLETIKPSSLKRMASKEGNAIPQQSVRSFDIVHLPANVACPKELVEVRKNDDEYVQILVLYDTGATITTGTRDVIPLDQRPRQAITGPVVTVGVNATSTIRYDHVELTVEEGGKRVPIRVNCREQQKTAPPPELCMCSASGVQRRAGRPPAGST